MCTSSLLWQLYVHCKKCVAFRGCLRVQSMRFLSRSSGRTDPTSHAPLSSLSNEELRERLGRLHGEVRRLQKQRDRLKQRIKKATLTHRLYLHTERNGCPANRHVVMGMHDLCHQSTIWPVFNTAHRAQSASATRKMNSCLCTD